MNFEDSLSTLKGGDILTSKSHCCFEAIQIINQCSLLVYADETLDHMEKAYAFSKLFHAQCYIMIDQHNIGDYLNG